MVSATASSWDQTRSTIPTTLPNKEWIRESENVSHTYELYIYEEGYILWPKHVEAVNNKHSMK